MPTNQLSVEQKAEVDETTKAVADKLLLYKFRPLAGLERLADILLNERLYCAKYYELNDPFEGICIVMGKFGTPEDPGQRYNCSTSVDDLLAPEDFIDVRVCSLAGSFDDIRLWSHYGGSHKGVAIEIDLIDAENAPFKVNYIGGLKRYDQTLGKNPSVKDILSHKTTHWEYENEYRILANSSYYDIRGRINRVLLGARCNQHDEQLIRRLVPKEVEVVRTKLNQRDTKVEV